MNQQKDNSKKAALTGVIAALAASSCCIPPVIALVAGVGGASSSLAWMEPFRPYLIGVAVLSIGYAWYAHLKPKPADDCGCDIEKPKFYQTRGFLIGVTVFAVLSIAFPYYAEVFYPTGPERAEVTDTAQLAKVEVAIDGMTCDACQNHVEHAVGALPGIIAVHASYANGSATVEFDQTQASVDQIQQAIDATGYRVTDVREVEQP